MRLGLGSDISVGYRQSLFGGVPFLLDTYTGAAAAYSLRKLRTAYTGAAIRVRESATNTEADIGFNADGTLNTTALLAHVGANDGFVVTWYDQAGSNNATQSTAANQPQIVASGSVITENTKPSLTFDGSNDAFTIANIFNALTTLSAFTISKKNATNTFGCLLSGFDSFITYNYIHQFNDDGKISYALSGLNNVTYATAISTYGTSLELNANIFDGALSNPNEYKLYRNSLSKTVTPNNANEVNQLNASVTSTTIGARLNAAYFAGKISELILYPSDQSANRTAIEQNINDHYNIYP